MNAGGVVNETYEDGTKYSGAKVGDLKEG